MVDSGICTLYTAKLSYYSSSNKFLTAISPCTAARYSLGPGNSTWTHTHSTISICGLQDSDHAMIYPMQVLSIPGFFLTYYWYMTLAMYLKKPILWSFDSPFLGCTFYWFKSIPYIVEVSVSNLQQVVLHTKNSNPLLILYHYQSLHW